MLPLPVFPQSGAIFSLSLFGLRVGLYHLHLLLALNSQDCLLSGLRWPLYPILDGCIWHHWLAMPTLEVIGITPALAAAARISLEWAVPRVVRLDIGHHVLRLVVPPQTVAAIFLPTRKGE